MSTPRLHSKPSQGSNFAIQLLLQQEFQVKLAEAQNCLSVNGRGFKLFWSSEIISDLLQKVIYGTGIRHLQEYEKDNLRKNLPDIFLVCEALDLHAQKRYNYFTAGIGGEKRNPNFVIYS